MTSEKKLSYQYGGRSRFFKSHDAAGETFQVKFGIGQQVRHRLSGVLGVIVDVDPEYSLDEPKIEDVGAEEKMRTAPWYHFNFRLI